MMTSNRDSRGGFRPHRSIEPSPLFRERPSEQEPYLRFADGNRFECFVHPRAVRQMAAYGQDAGEEEVIGRLAGRICTDGKGTYILVEKAALTSKAKHGMASVMADTVAQAVAQQDFERCCRPMDCVGWWHTHPGSLGLFYSPTDNNNQATWTDGHTVGIVMNPQLQGDILKVFRGPKSVELKAQSKLETHLLVPTMRKRVPATQPKGYPRVDASHARPAMPMQQCCLSVSCSSVLRRLTVGIVAAICIAAAAPALTLLAYRSRPDIRVFAALPPKEPQAVMMKQAPNALPSAGKEGRPLQPVSNGIRQQSGVKEPEVGDALSAFWRVITDQGEQVSTPSSP